MLAKKEKSKVKEKKKKKKKTNEQNEKNHVKVATGLLWSTSGSFLFPIFFFLVFFLIWR